MRKICCLVLFLMAASISVAQFEYINMVGLANDPFGDQNIIEYLPDDILYVTLLDWEIDVPDSRTQVTATLIQTPVGRRRIVRRVPLATAPRPDKVKSIAFRELYSAAIPLAGFYPGAVRVIIQAVSPGNVKYSRQSVIQITTDRRAPAAAEKQRMAYYTSTAGLSNDPLGDRDVTEYYPDESLYVFLQDAGLDISDPRTLVTARLVQTGTGPRGRNIVRSASLNPPVGLFRAIDLDAPVPLMGSIPLDAFKAGYAQLFIQATTPGGAGLVRQSVIRIMDVVK